jgi:hypothetical protein
VKAVWYLLALILGGLTLAGLRRTTHDTDVATLVGDIAITLLLLAGVWGCLRRANAIAEGRGSNGNEGRP